VVYVTAELALVEAFLNSRDHEDGPDGLAQPTGLDHWLRDHGLADRPRATVADLAAAVELREAVRAVVATGGSAPASARLAAAGGAFPLRLGDRSAGAPVLEPAGDGALAAVGRVAAAVAQAQVLGTWGRLKVCPAAGCGWAFVDRSRNGSRRWCEMSSCGNQQKVRSYRARRRSPAAGS
jgi:predicted RNA-binding Zn ribbon-like protein